jgi:hypothetical protein
MIQIGVSAVDHIGPMLQVYAVSIFDCIGQTCRTDIAIRLWGIC